MGKRERLNKIYSDIKSVKIQGATNIAKAAIKAYSMLPEEENKKKLISLRPTEPMLVNSLERLEHWPKRKILGHFEDAQKKINESVRKILKPGIIFTHCHSTNVLKALKYAKKKGKKIEVYNTETRPLFQGRLTAAELAKAGIKVTTFTDSGAHGAIAASDIVLLGADALLPEGIINKTGSAGIAEIAWIHKKPVYIVADSWKFSPKNVKIEERDFHEVWKKAPKHVKIRNPGFEFVEKKYLSGIISDLGIQKYDSFVKAAGR